MPSIALHCAGPSQRVEGLIREFEIEDRIGVFVGDNATNINSAVRALVRRFRLSNGEVRRSRCYGHIINLATQVFLLGKDCEAFINEVDLAE